MDEDLAEQIALFRYGVIADLLHFEAGARGNGERMAEKAVRTYQIPGSTRTHVAVQTMRDWLRAYRRDGFAALRPKVRADQGSNRALPPEVVDVLITLKEEHRSWTVRRVIAVARDSAQVPDSVRLAPSSVHRLLRSRGLMEKQPDEATGKDRRRFAFHDAGQLWMSDVMHGPSVIEKGRRKRKTYLPGVRTGLHMGEVIERRGPEGDGGPPRIEGLAVDLAARIAGLAQAAQVLMSAAVDNSARQRIDNEPFRQPIHWRAYGRYVLKGFDEPMDIREAGLDGVAGFVAPTASEKAAPVAQQGTTPQRRRGFPIAVASLVILFAVIGYFAWSSVLPPSTVPNTSDAEQTSGGVATMRFFDSRSHPVVFPRHRQRASKSSSPRSVRWTLRRSIAEPTKRKALPETNKLATSPETQKCPHWVSDSLSQLPRTVIPNARAAWAWRMS